MQIPANKLAEFITAKTPERRERIVRQVRDGNIDHPNYYQCFHKPAREFLIGGARDATDILRAIERLKTRTQTPWRTIDSRITTQALHSLLALGPELHRLYSAFVQPGSRTAVLHMPDADISVPPNLLVHGEHKGRPVIGALRFYLAKESPYQIGIRGAEMVGVMEYLWLVQVASEARTPDPSLCVVVECMQRRITVAPRHVSAHVTAIQRGCREFARQWRFLDEQATPRAAR